MTPAFISRSTVTGQESRRRRHSLWERRTALLPLRKKKQQQQQTNKKTKIKTECQRVVTAFIVKGMLPFTTVEAK